MKYIISTERLLLKEFAPEDGKNMFDLNSDPEVLKYTGDVSFTNLQEAKSFIQNYNQYKLFGMGRWSVFLKNGGDYIGWCGLKYHKRSNDVDLGFRLKRKYWNKGYATEAARACLDYGFGELGLKRIIGRVIKENRASISVLEKIGMTRINSFYLDGEYPSYLYEKLKD